MTAQGKQVLYSPVDIDDADFVDFDKVDPKMVEENEEFEKFKSEMHDLQDDAKITVSKKQTDTRGRPMGRKTFECFECGIDDYTFSQLCTRIREEYGTGLYKIQGRDSNGKFKFGRTVGIQAPYMTGTENEAGNNVGQLMDKFSDAMERQQDRTESMMKDLIGPQNSGDAIDQIVKIAGAVAPILAALGISRAEPPPPPKTLLEQLTEMQMVKELMGDNSDGPSGEANLYSMLGETMKALGPALASALVNGQSANPQSTQAALPAPSVAAPVEVATSPIDKEAQIMELKTQVGMLLVQAKGGADPKDLAKMIVDNTTPENEERLWDRISSDNCIPEMIALVPEVAEQQEWFENLRDEIIEILAEPELDTEKVADDIRAAAKGAESIPNPTPEDEFCKHRIVLAECSECMASLHDEVNEDNENLTGGRTPVQDAVIDAVAGVDHSSGKATTSEEAPLSEHDDSDTTIDS